jgi:hypothetical protein
LDALPATWKESITATAPGNSSAVVLNSVHPSIEKASTTSRQAAEVYGQPGLELLLETALADGGQPHGAGLLKIE